MGGARLVTSPPQKLLFGSFQPCTSLRLELAISHNLLFGSNNSTMERIPVERRRGTPAWVWLLLLLALLALLYFLFFKNDAAPVDEEYTDSTTTTQNYDTTHTTTDTSLTGGNTAAISDIRPVVTAANADDYVGKRVILTQAVVQGAMGDSTFWIGEGAERMFVVRDQNAPALSGLKNGQSVNIEGTVERMPEAGDRKKNWGIPDNKASDFEGQKLYIKASKISAEA